MRIDQISNINSVSDLPKITSFILPKEFELLPNTSEVFELEFAFYEHKFLTKEEIIHRGAFFKSIDGIPTYHYIICSNNSPLIWEGRSELTKSCFKEGNFSTGYATHGLFPYRGKFHPQLIKGLLNILCIQPGEIILDPMCGSGTLNVEASIIGIDSIGIKKSPFCLLMSKVKYEALKIDNSQLSEMARVLKIGKYTVIIIGSNDIQTGGIRLETKIEGMAIKHGFTLEQKIVKPIKGIQNTMKNEYILFFRRR